MAWLFVNVISLIFGLLSVMDKPLMGDTVRYSTVAGLILAIIGTIMLWRNSKVYNWALNVAYEMKQVTWPTMDETKYAMKVVIATSVIVALILFLFDFVSKGFTDWILGI
ncbi:MAG: preprotein translocase subunit SecE [Proteobacteria bacterium]|nr:preprotein translocase subunit SecE [Pseudomonadota bacterium]